MSSTDWPVDKEGRLRRAVPPAPQSKNATTTANASEARKRTVVSSPSVPAHSYPPEDKITVTEVAPLANEVPFTEGDYQIIEKEYSDIIDIPPATLVYAWEAFAQKVSSSVYIPASLCSKFLLTYNGTVRKAHSRRLV